MLRGCASCGECHAARRAPAYRSAGIVLRCPACDDVALRVATLPGRHIVQLSGSWTLCLSRVLTLLIEREHTLARIAVIYYSATGNVHALANAVAEGAESAGAEVRLRQVEEIASEQLISQNQHWGRHRAAVRDQPDATLDDLEWADGIAFGTPTRFGNVVRAAEAVHGSGGRPVAAGQARRQARDVVHVVADRARRPGVDAARAQQHLLPLGHGGRPARVHGARGLRSRAATRTAPRTRAAPNLRATSPTTRCSVARAQGARLARFAAVIAPAQADGRLPQAGVCEALHAHR